jgi:tRNA threonylcarbamoyladenosine biosynthesis protein TsaE
VKVIKTIASESEMEKLGGALSAASVPGCVIGLQGDLGAGKTTLSRGFMHALGHEGAVKSPTFTLVEPYDLSGQPVFHFDLYRIADPEELAYVGLDEYFYAESICLVEWPEKGVGVLPVLDVVCDIQVDGLRRQVCLESHSALGEKIIAHVEA